MILNMSRAKCKMILTFSHFDLFSLSSPQCGRHQPWSDGRHWRLVWAFWEPVDDQVSGDVHGERGDLVGRPARHPPIGHSAAARHITHAVSNLFILILQISIIHGKVSGGPLIGGPQCRMRILRNGNVACHCRLFSPMSHVEFKKMLCHMSL